MRATVYHGPRDMRIDQVPDPTLAAPTDVIAGTFDPSPILDMTVDLDGVSAGYAAMDERSAIKVLVRP